MYSVEGKAVVRSLESRVECCRDPLSSSSFLAVSGENVNSRADLLTPQGCSDFDGSGRECMSRMSGISIVVRRRLFPS